MQKGVKAVRTGDYVLAKGYFLQLARREPRNATAQYYLGVCEAREQRYDQAISHLVSALEFGLPDAEFLLTDSQFSPASSANAAEPLMRSATGSDNPIAALEMALHRFIVTPPGCR